MVDPQVRALARRLAVLEKARRQSKQPTLAYSTIDGGGAIQATDEDGALTMVVGQQFDGTNTSAVITGPTPPQPLAPLVSSTPGGLRVYWDGTFTGGAVAPMDFARVLVYAVPTSVYTGPDPLDQTRIIGQFSSATGGEVTAGLDPAEYAVYLVAWSQAGKFGPASDVALGSPNSVLIDYFVEYALGSSETVAPTTGWSTTPPERTPGSFIWQRTTVTRDGDSSMTDPVLLTGNTGAQGSQGIPGPAGADGTSLYTWLKYADTAAGAGMSDDPTGKTYIGLAYNKTSATESTNAADYTWSLIKGADGQDGAQGIPGPAGADGTSLYTWLKYADSPTTGMSDSPTGKTYMGIAYNKTSATESTNYADYSWSLIQGPQGATGAAGKGVSSTAVTYQVGTSGTTAPTGTWTTSIPATSPGQYLWTRTVTTYTDASTSTGYSVAAHGATGSTGAAGKGVSSTAVTYQVGSSGTTAPTGTWTTSIPATSPGQYLWTRTITTYTDSSTATAYSVAAHGATGAQGIQGPPGPDGQPTYTWIKYATDASGTSMSDDPTGRPYIGFAYNKTTQTESTVPGDYTWSLIQGPQGNPGTPGADGVTYYTWIKYATDASGTGLSDDPAGKTYIGIAYNKTSATESTTAADYTWSLIQGPQGNTGAAGRGISSTAVTYQVGSSGTTAPTGTWSSSVPATSPGQFLWTRTITTYTDATTATAYSVAAHGSTGSTGVGVSSTAVTYQVGSSGTTAPTGTWSSSVPATSPGQYLWTRTITTYTNSTTATAYSVAAHGSTGAQGTSITSVTAYYALVTEGAAAPAKPGNVATPPAPWVATEPAYSPGTDLYHTERVAFSNGTYSYTNVSLSSAYEAAKAAHDLAASKSAVYRQSTAPWPDGDTNHFADVGDMWIDESLGPGALVDITAVAVSGTTVTLRTATEHDLAVGKTVVVSGVMRNEAGTEVASDVLGTFLVTGVPTPSSITYTVSSAVARPDTLVTGGYLQGSDVKPYNRPFVWADTGPADAARAPMWVSVQDSGAEAARTLQSDVKQAQVNVAALEATATDAFSLAYAADGRVVISDYEPTGADVFQLDAEGKPVLDQTTGLPVQKNNGSLWITRTRDRLNECVNPSFEANATLWTATAGTLAQQTPDLATQPWMTPADGTKVARFTNDTSVGEHSVRLTSNITVNAEAQPIILSGFLRSISGVAAGYKARIEWLNGSTVVRTTDSPATTILVPSTDDASGRWTRIYVTDSSPTGATSARLSFVAPAGSGSAVWELDAVLVERTQRLGRYFDGDSEGGSYTGTPHLSTSRLDPTAIIRLFNLEDGVWAEKKWTADTIASVDVKVLRPNNTTGYKRPAGLGDAFDGALIGDRTVPIDKIYAPTVTCAEAVAAGDLVNVYQSGGVSFLRKAKAVPGFEAHGFVLQAGAVNAKISVYSGGYNPLRSGLTPGNCYLSATPGAVASLPPTTTGAVVQRVGYSPSGTTLDFTAGPAITIG